MYKLWSIAIAALLLPPLLTSCAYQPKVGEPLLSQEGTVQPAVTTELVKPEQRASAGRDKESDCVLTLGDVSVWCKWIAQYY